MQMQVTKDRFKASNNELSFSVENGLLAVEAWSYNWWRYVTTDDVGNIYFNNASYSKSTNVHQYDALSVLRNLGIEPNLIFRFSCSNAHGPRSMIRNELEAVDRRLSELVGEITKKGTHKTANERRLNEIERLEYYKRDLNRYLTDFLDRKLIPIKRSQDYDEINGYEKYFLKPNGKLKRNEYNAFYKQISNGWGWRAPDSIGKIKALLSLKPAQTTTVLLYKFAADVERMIPDDVDGMEYIALKRWCERRGIKSDGFHQVDLEKIHTYLSNKLNRRDRVSTPRVVRKFPLNPAAEVLKQDDEITLIENDRDLRAEGRRQSHCIGGKYYIDRCLRGYHALNFKGFTFFLDPDLRVEQTNGRHNSCTPHYIRLELEKLITEAKRAV